MGAVPVTINKWAVIWQQVVDYLVKGADDLAYTYLIAQPYCAWMSLPVIRVITQDIIAALGEQVRIQGATIAVNAVTDWQTKGEKSDVYNSAKDLQAAQASGDPAKKAAATAAWGAAVHWDGIAPVRP